MQFCPKGSLWGSNLGARDVFRRSREEEQKEIKGLTTRRIQGLIQGRERLVCISISDPATIKSIVIALTRNMLASRKREFKVKPYVLFVFDEAQEFIPAGASGIDGQCSERVETLLRQGRKYGLCGLCSDTKNCLSQHQCVTAITHLLCGNSSKTI